jgi:hypothetical protein
MDLILTNLHRDEGTTLRINDTDLNDEK